MLRSSVLFSNFVERDRFVFVVDTSYILSTYAILPADLSLFDVLYCFHNLDNFFNRLEPVTSELCSFMNLLYSLILRTGFVRGFSICTDLFVIADDIESSYKDSYFVRVCPSRRTIIKLSIE